MQKITGSFLLASVIAATGCGDLRTTMLVAPDRQGHAAGEPGHVGTNLRQVPVPGPGEMFVTMGPNDTLSSVAKTYGVDLATLIKRNDLATPPKPGANLIVPARATGASNAISQ